MTIRVNSPKGIRAGMFTVSLVADAIGTEYIDTAALLRPGNTSRDYFTFQSIGSNVTVSGTLQDPSVVLADPAAAEWVIDGTIGPGSIQDSQNIYTYLKVEFAGPGELIIGIV